MYYMENLKSLKEKLNWFNKDSSHYATFDLYNTLKPSSIDETIENLWNKLSTIYLINCSPFMIEDWKDYPEIHDILKRYENKAEWRSLDLIIWEYNEDTMNDMFIKTEELRKQYEWPWIEVDEPKKFIHMIGYYWWTSWRTIQSIIEKFKKFFPDKIKILTPDKG
jgi:hypothetical protein